MFGMIARRMIASVLFVAAFGGCAPAMADSAPGNVLDEIRYGYPEQPPRVFTNAAGVADGHYPRLLRVLFQRAGMRWRADAYPAPRLMRNLEDGVTDFSILVRNARLEACCLYGAMPVWRDELRVYRLAGTDPVGGWEDLVGESVIVLAGYGYGGHIGFINDPANRIAVQVAGDHEAAFAMLDGARASYLLDYGEPAEEEGLVKHPVVGVRHDKMGTLEMFFVISKRYPDAATVLSTLEGIYREMREADPFHTYTR